eukprot:TRINITY_DN683_c0_g1_i2.p1 TRINITY_DN683_c0_g1~~TRINITY_DN683_c0_g1_i2.p1  ORF type:complete len:304 (+),score=60.42 TRINITY_DN683_c0_g1_i2:42-953(+)
MSIRSGRRLPKRKGKELKKKRVKSLDTFFKKNSPFFLISSIIHDMESDKAQTENELRFHIRSLKEQIVELEARNFELEQQLSLWKNATVDPDDRNNSLGFKTVRTSSSSRGVNSSTELVNDLFSPDLGQKKKKSKKSLDKSKKEKDKEKSGKFKMRKAKSSFTTKRDIYKNMKKESSSSKKRNAVTSELDLRRPIIDKNGEKALVFGRDLKELQVENNLPQVLNDCFIEIRKRGLDLEGIFRVPGNRMMIDVLRENYDSGGRPTLSDASVNDIASLTKEFFRSLPQPIVPKLHQEQIPLIIGS